MSRLGLAPENSLITDLKQALNEIEQLKQAQPIGSDSLRPQILQSSKPYDYTAEQDLLNPPFYYYVWFSYYLTAAHQANPYAQIFASVFDLSGNVLPWSSIDLFSSDPLFNNGDFYKDDNMTAQQFAVRCASQFRLKYYIQASDNGSLVFDVVLGTPAP